MNAVEIEEAITALAEQPFDAAEFPFAFLQAFGNKETTIKKLRAGASNRSDLGGVLQTSHIHILVCQPGDVSKSIAALKASPATAKAKARFVLATDGDMFQAEDLTTDDPPVACAYRDFPEHFGFFLPLANITTVQQVRESSFDIRATGRLNRLYVELLKDNPDWGTAARRHDMNHFMARLIFCFFAEDTDIFNPVGLFTARVTQMSERPHRFRFRREGGAERRQPAGHECSLRTTKSGRRSWLRSEAWAIRPYETIPQSSPNSNSKCHLIRLSLRNPARCWRGSPPPVQLELDQE